MLIKCGWLLLLILRLSGVNGYIVDRFYVLFIEKKRSSKNLYNY
jgi:hypothetical protein